VTLTELNWQDMFTYGGVAVLALIVMARFLLRG